jgi:hypothetical protein
MPHGELSFVPIQKEIDEMILVIRERIGFARQDRGSPVTCHSGDPDFGLKQQGRVSETQGRFVRRVDQGDCDDEAITPEPPAYVERDARIGTTLIVRAEEFVSTPLRTGLFGSDDQPIAERDAAPPRFRHWTGLTGVLVFFRRDFGMDFRGPWGGLVARGCSGGDRNSDSGIAFECDSDRAGADGAVTWNGGFHRVGLFVSDFHAAAVVLIRVDCSITGPENSGEIDVGWRGVQHLIGCGRPEKLTFEQLLYRAADLI